MNPVEVGILQGSPLSPGCYKADLVEEGNNPDNDIFCLAWIDDTTAIVIDRNNEDNSQRLEWLYEQKIDPWAKSRSVHFDPKKIVLIALPHPTQETGQKVDVTEAKAKRQ